MVRLHAARTGLERGAVEGEGREGEGREGKGRGSGLDGTTAHFFVCQRTRPPAESAEPCVLRRVAQGVDLIAGGRTKTKHNAEERECVPAAAGQGEQRTHSLCPPIDAAATACASAQRSAVACVVASSPLCQRTRPPPPPARAHSVRLSHAW